MPAATPQQPAEASTSPVPAVKKVAGAPEKKYKCQFCNRAFSRSEHRSRHERSHTKERPFKCFKCRSTFVRRDLLLRHDRTVHAKDGGVPLQSDFKRRSSNKDMPSDGSEKHEDTPPPTTDPADSFFGVEEAAMLMTNFQQKAAMSSQAAQVAPMLVDGPSRAGDRPYGVPDMTLPQMQWDTMVPQSSSQPQADMLDPFLGDSRGPYNAPSQIPSIEQTLNAADVSLSGFPTMSGYATPGALSPFPAMMGPVSPVDYRRSPGPPQMCKTARAPQIESEEQLMRIMDNIKKSDREGAVFGSFRLPEVGVINRYLSTYFNLFHHHLPFLHPASFDPSRVSAALLLSVLSIGALYTFEAEKAYSYHVASKLLVAGFLQYRENFSSRKAPLWAMQATLLNMEFASWSGDPKGVEWACSMKSLVANMVAGNNYELRLRCEARGGAQPSHAEWIEDEGCRRSYYAVYIFFGLLTLTYNHTPAISFNEFETLDLPASESLWSLGTGDEETWRQIYSSTKNITFKEAHHALFQGETAQYSAFATRIMINALSLETWYHKRSPQALQDVVTEHKLRLALETWDKSLELCEPETVIVQLSAPHKGHPLIFNAKAMRRNTTARLMVDLKSVQEALRYHDSFEVAGAMTRARDGMKRSAEMLNVIEACFECIEVAAMQGIRWVARTSATNWSIEHPLCGMDLLVILTHWLWCIEHDEEPATPEELAMYKKISALFDADSAEAFDARLSSTVSKLWGSMQDEVVVWGITKLMGESFKIHAKALSGYEDALNSGAAGPEQAMPAQPSLAVAAY